MSKRSCAQARKRGHDCRKRVAGDKPVCVCVYCCLCVSRARQTDRCHWPFSLRNSTHTHTFTQPNNFVCTFFSCVCFFSLSTLCPFRTLALLPLLLFLLCCCCCLHCLCCELLGLELRRASSNRSTLPPLPRPHMHARTAMLLFLYLLMGPGMETIRHN